MIAVRKNLVFFVLLGLLGVLGIGLATRDRKPHTAPPAPSASAETLASAAASASPLPAPSASAAPPGAPAGLGRPLRVSGPGWEVLAPILLANGGLEPKQDSDVGKAGLEVAVTVARDTEALEGALARGGSDEAGADLAVMPLASVVGSYKKLQALRPVVVLVTAWSRGREVVRGKEPLDKLPPSGELVVAAAGDASATYLALFALELAGVAPGRVRMAEPGDAKVRITAQSRADLRPAEQKDVLVSSAEATRFAPWVLVCPAALADKHKDPIAAFLKAWLAGAKRLASDPTAAARALSALKDAPEPIALLSRLGELAAVGLGENAELLGLSGRGAVTVDSLLSRHWRLGREAKLVDIAPPEGSLVLSGPVAQLVRADPSQAKLEPAATATAKSKPGTRPLLVARTTAPLDVDAAESDIGFVAGVFQRSPMRISAQDKRLADRLVKQSSERFALAEGRLLVGATPSKAGEALIEVMPIP